MSTEIKKLPRREFLLASGALTLMAGSSQAASKGDHQHGAGAYTALAKESQHCVLTGNECLSHCIADMRSGNLELTECLARVEELVATCAAMAKLAALQSEYVPAMAAVTRQVCETCEKECRKFADKHDTCRTCADSCVACMKECDKIIEAA